MKTNSTAPKATITFELDEGEARNLLAYFQKDETVPWGIDNGRTVQAGIERELEIFVRGLR